MFKFNTLPQLQRLQELFSVDDNGRLLYRQKAHPCSRRKPGDEAGCLDPEGYRKVFIDGKRYFAHRIIWFLAHKEDPKSMQIDHINGDRDDNRLANLRLCNNAQNCLNTKLRSTNTSGIRGVSFAPKNRKKPWRALYRRKSLGWFATKQEAAEAVAKAVAACKDREFYRTEG